MPRMMRGNVPQKAKNVKKSLIRLAKYIKSFIPLLIVALILVITSTVFRLIGPNKLSKITEIVSKALPMIDETTYNIIPGISYEMSSIWKIVNLLVVLYVLGLIFNYIANVLIARISFKVGQKVGLKKLKKE